MSAVIKLSSPATQQFWEIPVLYEDEHLLALNKPPGMPTTTDPDKAEAPGLMDLLHAAIERGVPWSKENGRTFLAPSQRLDPETGGLLLLAKSKPVLVTLLNGFGSEQPGRSYVALIQGTPPNHHFRNGSKLSPNPIIPGSFQVDPREGKHSLTAFEVVEKFAKCTLMKCEALTDRPHQIRVHLRNLGLPLVGDELYGGRPLWLSRLKPHYRLKPNRTEQPLLDRPALHADALTLPHPVTGAELKISAPWPKDLTVAVKYLRRYAAGQGVVSAAEPEVDSEESPPETD